MHILKIIHGYPPLYNAGSEVYSQTLCEALAQNHQVTIFTREADPYRPDFEVRIVQLEKNLTLYIVNMPREKDGFDHPDLNVRFAKYLSTLNPDVAHIGHLNHLSTGWVNVLNRAKVPIIFTLHDFWLMCPRGQFLQINFNQPAFYQLCEKQDDQICAQNCYNRFFPSSVPHIQDLTYWTHWIAKRMAATRTLCQYVDVFIAPSRYLMKRFISDFGIESSRIQYLDYGFDRQRFMGRKRQKESAFTFGYIGTHIPSKGVDLLIQAFSTLEGDVQLRIWGRESGQSTQALKSMAALSANVIEFKGEYVNKNMLEMVFNYVDAIVVPSIWMENAPLVIHEAQACGVPVITADAGGMAEYVQHKVNGLLFQHRDKNSLADQMNYALANPEEMKQLGNRGYLFSSDGQIPDIHQHVADLEDLYESLINSSYPSNPSTYVAHHA
ncbi:MAG: glycosyltransferase [Bacteroidota bacterium]